MLSDEWWFWASVAIFVVGTALVSARFRGATARVRALALERGLVDPGTGRRIDTRPGGFWSDLSWLSLLLGAWVATSPWIWGYDDVHGAVATDVVSGAAVVVLTLAGIVFAPLNALSVLVGLWLVLAPWVVGYGDQGGPVGLSDTLAGVLIAVLALTSMTAAAKRIVPGAQMPVGRIRRSAQRE